MALEELDYDYNVHTSEQATRNLAVKFYLHPMQDDVKSDEEGRACYNDVEFVEVRVRGDRNNVVQRPARPDDKRVFRDAYRAFKDGEAQAVSGTPLAEWPTITKSLLEEMKYMGFFTVEQLAEASDSVCSKFAGLQTYKQKAINFLRFAKEAAPIAALQKVADDAKNESEVLRRQLAEMVEGQKTMQAQIEALQGKKK